MIGVVSRLTARTALVAACALPGVAGCERHEIPAHVADPARFLTGGERVFFDDFQRAELGPKWQLDRLTAEPAPATWRIVDGWVVNDDAKNQGIWAEIIPPGAANVRVEFLAKSEPLPGNRPFPGDLKCEAFGTGPRHESGYSFINGGWTNQFDTIAKKGEHSADDRRSAARAVEPSRVYRYAAVRAGNDFYWYRDGELLYPVRDDSAAPGGWFALNNWLSTAHYDEVAVYVLSP